jgi:hypothetical protein
MELFLTLFGAMIGASVLIAITSSLWFNIRWDGFGWRPKILDEEKVTETVAECTAEAVANDIRDAEEIHGYTMSEKEKRDHAQSVQKVFRTVIERYIKSFSQKLY